MGADRGQRRQRRAWRNAGMLALVASMAVVSLAAVPASAGGPLLVDRGPHEVPPIESPPTEVVLSKPELDAPAQGSEGAEPFRPKLPSTDSPTANSPQPEALVDEPQVAVEPVGFVPGESVEDTSARTEFTSTYANPDGTRTLSSATAPLNYLAGDEWRPIDNSIIEDPHVPGGFRNAANAWTARFLPLAAGGVLVQAKGQTIGFRPDTSATSQPALDHREVVYPEAWADVDVRYSVGPRTVEETLVLKSPDAPASFGFTTETAFDPDPDVEGGWIPRGPASDTVRVRPPFATDSEGRELTEADVSLDFTESGGVNRFTLSVDPTWLSSLDPSDFPVLIDPTVDFRSADGADGNVRVFSDTGGQECPGGQSTACYYLKVGDDGAKKWRSVVKFDYCATVCGTNITDVKFHVWEQLSGGINGDPEEGVLYRMGSDWAYAAGTTMVTKDPMPWRPNQPTYADRVIFEGQELEDYFQYGADNNSNGTDRKVGLRMETPSGTGLRRYDWAELLVTYNSYPNTPTIEEPDPGEIVNTLRPKLDASATDPDGTTITKFKYQVCTNSAMTSGCKPYYDQQTDPYTIPSGHLGWGTTYWWRAWAWDGATPEANYSKSPSSPVSFTTNRLPVIASQSPATGVNLNTLRPTLSVTATDADDNARSYMFVVCNDSGLKECVWQSNWSTSSSVAIPSEKLEWGRTYHWKAYVTDNITPVVGTSSVRTFVTENTGATAPTLSTPTANAVVADLTPTFVASATSTVVPPSPLQYEFEVSSADPGEGRKILSPWTANDVNAWTVPPGSLLNGMTYTWRVHARDATSTSWVGSWSTPRSFKVDLGFTGTAVDALGPAAVNLVSGNLNVAAGGPSFDSLGGATGASFSYNSRGGPPHGLSATYWADPDKDGVVDSDEKAAVQRFEPGLLFDWSGAGPSPEQLDAEHFTAKWSGFITMPDTLAGGEHWSGWPTPPSFKFVVKGDYESVSISVDENVVLDATQCCDRVAGSSVRLSTDPSAPSRITITYRHGTGPAKLHVMLRDAGVAEGADPEATDFELHADWLTPLEPALLPDGWATTVTSMGNAQFTALRSDGETTVVTDAAGVDRAFTWDTAAGAWQPRPEDAGMVLTQTDDQNWALVTLDGSRHRFGPDGRLIDVTTVADDGSRISPVYGYSQFMVGTATVTRLASVNDASNRAARFTYSGGGTCPTAPPGFDTSPPAGMLCRVDYSDYSSGTTDLFYVNKHLARIANPGGELTDFGYDSVGRLITIRDPLTNDLIAGGTIPLSEAGSTTHMTLVSYDSYDAKGRVSALQGPRPGATATDADRPCRAYSYTASQTKVYIEGVLTRSSGTTCTTSGVAPARTVSFDTKGRVTSEVDAAGVTAQTSYDADGRSTESRTIPVGATSGGMRTTSHYNAAGNPTDTYGPAAAGEFAADGTSVTAPRARTFYDEGFDGLQAEWFTSSNATGAPVLHTRTGLNTGAPNHSPTIGSSVLQGGLVVPSTGAWSISVDPSSFTTVTIDGVDVIDRPRMYAPAVLLDHPHAYWRLGESSSPTAADASGNNRSGTYGGSLTKGVPGGLTADADTAVTMGATGGSVAGQFASVIDDFSVEAWVKPTATHEIDTESSEGSGGESGQRYLFPAAPDPAEGHATVGVSVGTNGISVYERTVDDFAPVLVWPASGTTVDLGTAWHHVVVSYDDGIPILYVDGDVKTTGHASGADVIEAPTSVGGNAEGWFAGSIDEVAFFAEPLGEEGVADHHRAGAPTMTHSYTTGTPLTAGSHEIEVTSYQLSAASPPSVQWTAPGGSAVAIPNSALEPRYGHETRSVDPDGRTTVTQYQDPVLGLVEGKVVDPSGLNLRTEMTYETGSGSLHRLTSRTMPKGTATPDPDDYRTTYEYYSITETADSGPGQCSGPGAVVQAGKIESVTAPDPDGTGPQQAIVSEFRYDAAGRQVASRVVGDADWTCVTFDARGRALTATDQLGRVTTYGYSTPGVVTITAPDSNGTQRTTVAKVDWLGRPISYTDEWGTITETIYDRAGRIVSTYRTFTGGSKTQLEAATFSGTTGRLTSTTEYVSGSPKTTTYQYDDYGRAVSETRPNGVVTTNDYSASRGTLTSVTHTKGAATLWSGSYQYSAAERLSSQTESGISRAFTYDGAGRLTQTVEGSTTRRYAYDANTNRCALAADCTSPGYSYDRADRILSSPDASSYLYDDHGNLVGETSTARPASALSKTGRLSASQDLSYPVLVGKTGDVSASVSWTDPPVVDTGSASGSLPTSGSATGPIGVDGFSHVKVKADWTKGIHTRNASWSPGAIPAGASVTQNITTDEAGTITASGTWTETTAPYSANGTVGTIPSNVDTSNTLTISGNGTVDVTLSWPSATPNPSLSIALMDGSTEVCSASPQLGANSVRLVCNVSPLTTYPQSKSYTVKVTATATGSSYSISGTVPVRGAMTLRLETTGGNVLANSTQVSGQTKADLSYANAPAGTYVLRASAATHPTPATVTQTYRALDFASGRLTLKDPSGAVLAQTSSSSGSATVTSFVSTSGSYSWRLENQSSQIAMPSYAIEPKTTTLATTTVNSSVILPTQNASHNTTADAGGPARITLDWDQSALGGHASVTATLYDAANNALGSASGSAGHLDFVSSVPSSGTYHVVVQNTAATKEVPSYALKVDLPTQHLTNPGLRLVDAAGSAVATASGTSSPKSLSVNNLPGGHYRLVVPAKDTYTQVTVNATYPTGPGAVSYEYDAHDHATEIDDGSTVVSETLTPSGRVIERFVRDKATQTVLEHLRYGYGGSGDAPTYLKDVASGTVTTYLGGVTYTGTTPTYALSDRQGTVVGSADAGGVFAANPVVDEFGVGQAPADRLGWFGTEQRYSLGSLTGVIRMGVRLYDPDTARFLSVDPVEGGCANDYVYVHQDPLNATDLTGAEEFIGPCNGYKWRRAWEYVGQTDYQLSTSGVAKFDFNPWSLIGIYVIPHHYVVAAFHITVKSESGINKSAMFKSVDGHEHWYYVLFRIRRHSSSLRIRIQFDGVPPGFYQDSDPYSRWFYWFVAVWRKGGWYKDYEWCHH